MRFELGQEVWRAGFESCAAYVTCPDCGGTKSLKVILFDGTEYDIPCAGCMQGFDGPLGVLQVYDRKPVATLATIKGVSVNGSEIEWSTADYYGSSDANLFLTRDEAMVRASEMATQMNADDINRVLLKEKDARSWSWHVHYYRKQIRDAEATIELATKLLGNARAKAKLEKTP